MNKIIITQHEGVTQRARLLTTGFGNDWSLYYRQPMAYVAGIDFQWFAYIELEDMPAYHAWYTNLSNSSKGELCMIAKANVKHNCLKGWAALNLLTEDPTMLTERELILAIEAADLHTRTLVGRNALEILQEESDNREFGY